MRQVMSPIDLRSQAERQGITRNQQTAQAIAEIMKTVGAAEQKRRESQTLDRITRAMAGGATVPEAIMASTQEPEFGTGISGALQKIGGMFQPSPGGMRQNIQQAIMGQAIQTDPLDTEYKRAQIKATESLTKQRQEAAKQELPDRMLRQADRWLRIVDDVMSEYWYTPEGPYRDKLLKDAQNARKKAVKLIKRYGATSEAGKASLQQLEKIDEEIKQAGGIVSQPKKVGTITATYGDDTTGQKGKAKEYRVDSYPAPKDKAEFDSTFTHISDPKEKQRYIDKFWREEFGRHLK